MQIEIRQYEQRDAAQAAEIWNEVVEDGKAFRRWKSWTR